MTCAALVFNQYRFCPRCGASLKKSLVQSTEPQPLVCTACGAILYPDPKVVACVIVDIAGQILLVRRKRSDDAQRWLLPGGFVNAGEAIEAAAQREIKEETGLDISLDGLVGVFSSDQSTQVIIVYYCRLPKAHPYPDNEIKALALFAPQDLPWGQLTYASSRQALQAYLQGQFCRLSFNPDG